MSDLRDAARMALLWLKWLPDQPHDAPYWTNGMFAKDVKDAVESIRAALSSEPAQAEPVATDGDIKAIEDALAAGPTPGEWEFGSYAGREIRVGPKGDAKHRALAIMTGRADVPWNHNEESRQAFNDAAYIAACNPAAIAELLARLRAAEADAERWQALYRRAVNEANGLTNYVEDRQIGRAHV